ncbi:hypothetical protein CMQ_4631 [Grosmannia clavigera kw1407]|uniref:ER membrane protein complex subunit 7 beta-sandwich domain-containing protein n=1 Tax=Grosmannia clavigera (strain kw1407 / UAMH 11150) TaxID=655863 RepID=F0XTS1_GROCL|nr:uncharacterized protein CMQ_4631 [Grosmannia clavigera kw1407]EFW98779.1 hypothetical protein CMQ_4631 [Grosmannia clavigera kw1407]
MYLSVAHWAEQRPTRLALRDLNLWLSVPCATHFFPPVRVDAVDVVDGGAAGKPARLVVTASETYRGNDWANRGEALVRVDSAAAAGASSSSSTIPTFVLRPISAQPKAYYTDRSGFSALSILRNPMILIALVTMGIVFGMPYLVENMDPEMRAEWEERQKSNPMNSLMGAGVSGAPGGGAPGTPSFDMAAYLAGSTKTESGSGSGAGSGAGKAGDGGTRRNQGVRR